MIEYSSKNYSNNAPFKTQKEAEKFLTGKDYVCPACVHRKLSMKSKTCQSCIFYRNSPNYKFDIKLINSRIGDFSKLKEE
jgi:hypothetical protein